jgi:CBS domain containing-hemolysin-like protein
METFVLVIVSAILVALIAMSAFFSASETAYTTLNSIRIKNLANEGNKKAEKALKHYENYERLLTTILVGNNLVNIGASAICTMLFTELFPESLGGPVVGGMVAIVFMVTVLLLCGEITPKTLAKRNAERYALRFAGALHFAEVVLSPIAYIFMGLVGAISKNTKNDSEETPSFTEDELMVMIDEIEEEGTLEKRESDLIKSAIEFDDIKVSEIYTPRVDLVAVEKDTDVEELRKVFQESEFSRIPVYDSTVDRIIGAVYAKDFYRRYIDGKDFVISDILRPVRFVPETTSIATLQGNLQKAKVHMAVVLDNFGGTLGIVTMEDILEELVGEIWDEDDEVQYEMVKEDDGSYTVMGEANIYDIMDELGLSFHPIDFQSHSVSGYIHHVLERIPKVGDVIETESATIIVKSMKSRRIKEAKIIPDQERTEIEDEEETQEN